VSDLELPPPPAPGNDGRYSIEQLQAYAQEVQEYLFNLRGRWTAQIVMAYLRKHPEGKTQQEIAKACNLRPSTVHEVVNKTEGVRVCRWLRANVRGYFSPVWCLGDAPDAPHPWRIKKPEGFKVRTA
jgi:hypothetical protein